MSLDKNVARELIQGELVVCKMNVYTCFVLTLCACKAISVVAIWIWLFAVSITLIGRNVVSLFVTTNIYVVVVGVLS